MNDRHLFRAKRTDNGELVEGYIFRLKTTTAEYKNKDRYLIFTGEFDTTGLFLNFVRYEVKPSTICQCTGLKDKNGKLIWENDILRGYLDDSYPENATYAEVLWWRNGFYTREKGSNDVNELDAFTEQNFEVCGNIFDNPELLEVGE